MKIDFSNLNIQPMPNPKPLHVERVQVSITNSEGKTSFEGEGRIVNANLYPAALTRRW